MLKCISLAGGFEATQPYLSRVCYIRSLSREGRLRYYVEPGRNRWFTAHIMPRLLVDPVQSSITRAVQCRHSLENVRGFSVVSRAWLCIVVLQLKLTPEEPTIVWSMLFC